MAKILGYQVATNTTVYKETDVKEIEQMFEFFSSLEVDGHTISPGYDYDAAKKDMVKRLGKQAGGLLPDARDDAARSSRRSRSGASASPSSARRFTRSSWPANAS